MNTISSKTYLKGAVFLILVLFTASCGVLSPQAAVPTAVCGYVVGDGTNDRQIHEIVYPGTEVRVGTNEDAYYVPCGPRTFIINPKGELNANGDQIGDRHFPVEARTSDGTPVKVWLTAYWTLNQGESALSQFYEVCHKFNCFNDTTQSGDANYSSRGWNGMLAETFSPAIDDATRAVTTQVDDSVWKQDNPEAYETLEVALSEQFLEDVRVTTGFNQDLFCGSGNSGWSNPDNPGEGDFTCTQVRFSVNDVEPVNSDLADNTSEINQTQSDTELNEARLNAARAKYGDNAEYWLGLQDSINACRKADTRCTIVIGGNNAPSVNPPQP